MTTPKNGRLRSWAITALVIALVAGVFYAAAQPGGISIEADVTSMDAQHKSLRQLQAEWDNEIAAANAASAGIGTASSPDS